MADARLAIKGTGPMWHEFAVTVDGKVLPVLRLTIEIDPNSSKCQATLVIQDFDLDATEIPARLISEKSA